MALHDQTEQQPLENEVRMAIDDIRRGNAIAFAIFTSQLFMMRIEPERVQRAKDSRHVTLEEYVTWETAYCSLPQAEREEAERLINYFAGGLNEYLTFRIGADEFGINILRVQEIRSFEQPTEPGQQEGVGLPYFLGTIMLRGDIVPLIDLRIKLGVRDPAYNAFTVTVMVQSRDQRYRAGVVVDAVSEVIEISQKDIQGCSVHDIALGTALGTAQIKDRLIRLVALDAEIFLANTSARLAWKATA